MLGSFERLADLHLAFPIQQMPDADLLFEFVHLEPMGLRGPWRNRNWFAGVVV